MLTDVDVLVSSRSRTTEPIPNAIPECNLALSIDWAHNLYRKTWVSLEQLNKNALATITIVSFADAYRWQPHLQTIQEKCNVKGY